MLTRAGRVTHTVREWRQEPQSGKHKGASAVRLSRWAFQLKKKQNQFIQSLEQWRRTSPFDRRRQGWQDSKTCITNWGHVEGLCQTCGRIIYGVTKKGLIITEICSGVFDFSIEQSLKVDKVSTTFVNNTKKTRFHKLYQTTMWHNQDNSFSFFSPRCSPLIVSPLYLVPRLPPAPLLFPRRCTGWIEKFPWTLSQRRHMFFSWPVHTHSQTLLCCPLGLLYVSSVSLSTLSV